ncbi:hypothetical protein A2872_01610 [Candidatus Gottesmanbacteria bacterium RIFCSPHIGHO2_01_FULL_42_12]|uniref:Uncharacterized protein n=1 Tax=Candidatus Gottesmanbacteria bacterium RIFCSPHIGHO2_01_FULL_42_12 TaxID=1798377 RepID=A0A1F5Z4N2_9BACT|nr:MAG: hypothetical protein A2872_01610 [Candidatus Gottesmanbacteria bacterium RIFCSPHIGHO2_01_FULL_42_12]
MSIQEISHCSLLVTDVTAENLINLGPWLDDGERINTRRGTRSFATRQSLDKIKNGQSDFLGIPVATPEGRWSVVDLKINLRRGEVYVVLHPGQPDVDLNPIARALNS